VTPINKPTAPLQGLARDLVTAARQGSPDALGQVLENCRPYLLLLANQELDPVLGVKVAPSDLVQETFLEAHRDFAQFRGQTEAELLGWLRQILLRNTANLARAYRQTGKRQVSREIALDAPADSRKPQLPAGGDSPSSAAVREEEAALLHAALARLEPDHREAIRLRNYERLPFEEVGRRLGRTAEAARKLWARAVDALRIELERPAGGP
jgi:RNA polymerase sigma-70 factor (ECF subfamily)